MPVALAALDRGGTLAIAGIHLSDIPPLDYADHLFEERQLRSVTANTRRDGEEFLALAASIGIRVETSPYPLERADRRSPTSPPIGSTAPPCCSPDPAGHPPDPGAGQRAGTVGRAWRCGSSTRRRSTAGWSRCAAARSTCSTLPTLRGALGRVVTEAAGAVVTVDLDEVDSLDDAGLGVILGAAGRARRSDGDLVVVCSDPDRRARLAVTGFDRAVTVRSALDAR